MNEYTYNKTILVEPFPTYSIKTKVSSGFAELEQKNSMTPLKVVVGNRDGSIQSGDVVWVDSEQYKMPWAKRIFNFKETKCIVLPDEFVQVVEYSENRLSGGLLNILENCNNDHT